MSTTIPKLYSRLIDDASMFPPGDLPLPEAVAQHAQYRAREYSALVGNLVVSSEKLEGVARQAGAHFGEPVAVVVVTNDAALEVATTTAAGLPELHVAALEVRVGGADVASSLSRLARVLDEARLDGRLANEVPVYVELDRALDSASAIWSAAVEQVAESRLRLKFRLGGLEAAAFPNEADLARRIGDAVGAGVVFKCTAGLHRAIRHRDATTGFEHHGFLNVLAATAAAGAAAPYDDVRQLLVEQDAAAVVQMIQSLAQGDKQTLRKRFVSFGSCSVTEPYDDLLALGLVHVGAAK